MQGFEIIHWAISLLCKRNIYDFTDNGKNMCVSVCVAIDVMLTKLCGKIGFESANVGVTACPKKHWQTIAPKALWTSLLSAYAIAK